MSVTYVGREEALDAVAARVEDVEGVLDLGPGICPQPFVKNPYVHICVEAHRPYIERVKREVADDPKYVFINSPWDRAVGMLPDKSVDTVFALDFIEHLEKEDGLRMLPAAYNTLHSAWGVLLRATGRQPSVRRGGARGASDGHAA